jgi:phosphatidylinositol glycan class V
MKMNRELLAIIKMSLKSRSIVLLLQLVLNLLINDHKSDAFLNGFESELKSESDLMIDQLFNGLNRWDSQYFMAIAYKGYQKENFLAFFPLFPLMVRLLALLFSSINLVFGTEVVAYYCLLEISAAFLNLILFIMTSIVLYLLTVQLFGSKQMAEGVVHWFCYNPSSIFFSAFYSESLFAFLTFSAIYFTNKSLIIASILFGLSSGTRSNGMKLNNNNNNTYL